jgi:putative IMPACT (imprinted ancient) family translation regulator
MKTKFATCLLGLAMLSACTTAKHTNVTAQSKPDYKGVKASRYASNNAWGTEAAAPMQMTEDIPAEGPADLTRNPALVPSPLLRTNAIGNP